LSACSVYTNVLINHKLYKIDIKARYKPRQNSNYGHRRYIVDSVCAPYSKQRLIKVATNYKVRFNCIIDYTFGIRTVYSHVHSIPLPIIMNREGGDRTIAKVKFLNYLTLL